MIRELEDTLIQVREKAFEDSLKATSLQNTFIHHLTDLTLEMEILRATVANLTDGYTRVGHVPPVRITNHERTIIRATKDVVQAEIRRQFLPE